LCAAINAGIKHAQNSSANSKIEDAEKLDLSIVSFVPETTTGSNIFEGNTIISLPAVSFGCLL
jgi:glutamate N-acetyltransferase/amino-acid N-acetyltransferase